MDGGIKVQVHTRHEPPQIESFGLSIAASMQASLDVHKVSVSLLLILVNCYR